VDEATGFQLASENAAVVLVFLTDWMMRAINYWLNQLELLRLWAQDNSLEANVLMVNALIIILIIAVRLDQRRRREKLLQLVGLGMAKWKKGHLANVLSDAIANAEGLSRQEKRALTLKVAELFGLDDLLPRRWNRKAVAYRVKKNCELMAKQLVLCKPEIPGGIAKPGEVPEWKDLGSDFLAKRKSVA